MYLLLMTNEQKYVGRLAPSPSGRMHLGNVFSFLIAWAEARKNDGKLIFRMEDLDDRCKNKEVQDQLVRDLEWLGIDWDGPIVYQSKRLDLYEEAFRDLNERDLLYPCFCSRADLHAASAPHASDGTPIYAGTCRNLSAEEIAKRSEEKAPAWRVKVPDEVVEFDDEICGHVEQNLKDECGDFIVRRSDGVFAYQLACVVDDLEMGINHVVRGNDLLSSTPRQLWLMEQIRRLRQAQRPNLEVTKRPNLGVTKRPNLEVTQRPNLVYKHIPLLVNEAGQRLSKRDKSLDIGEMIEAGETSETIVGKVALLLGLVSHEQPLTTQAFLYLYLNETPNFQHTLAL